MRDREGLGWGWARAATSGAQQTCSCGNDPTLHLQLLGELDSPVDLGVRFVLFLADWKSQES